VDFSKIQLEAISIENWGNHESGIIGAIRTVRNNLFHGGKAGVYNDDAPRNISLVNESVTILLYLYRELAAQSNQNLKKIYEVLEDDCSFNSIVEQE
jgi:hypothetical protein